MTRIATLKEDSSVSVFGPKQLETFVSPKLSSMFLMKLLRFLPVSKAIVVSRYREYISWIPPEWMDKVILYSKGPRDNQEMQEISKLPFQRLTHLENVGRESHAYLRYILDHYETLPDLVYFTQANPFDHAPDLITFHSGFHRTIKHLLESDISIGEVIHFSPGAIFVMKKEAILSRSTDTGTHPI